MNRPQNKSIGIVCAMREEAAAALSHLSPSPEQRLNGKPYYMLEWENRMIHLIVSRIGYKAAAKAAQYLIDHCRPDYLLNFGTAGGVDPKIQVGDVIISRMVIDASSPFIKAYPGNKFLLQQAANIPYLLPGIIISTNSNVASPSERLKLARTHHAQACDWESAAILRIAQENHVPAVAIRGISDIGKEPLSVEFINNLPQVMDKAGKVLVELLMAL